MPCPRCGQANPPHARFCNNCGWRFDRTDARSPAEERRIVTVLFCDLAGFTERSDHADPEDVKATLRPFHARVQREVERFGGTLDKFVGDAGLGVFGAPIAHEDDPERAVRAGLAIQEAMADLNAVAHGLDLVARVGIATGEAVIAFGRGPQIGEAVTGDIVNTAARIQSVAAGGTVAVADSTYDLTRELFEYVEVGPVRVKGKAEPLRIQRAVAARSPVPRGMEGARTVPTPFVGREYELALLQSLYRQSARRGTVQLVTLTGQPGLGKTRLIEELHASFGVDDAAWRAGRCLPYGDGITFWPLREIVQSQAGILESDEPAAVEAKLAAAIERLVTDQGERAWFVARLGPLVGMESASSVDRPELFVACRRFVESMARLQPVVLVFEDMHWADDAMLEFLTDLVEDAADLPILLLVAARPELFERRPTWGGGMRNAATLPLLPLGEAEIAVLISALVDRPLLTDETRAALLERSGGNPLYTEEFVRMLRDRGLVERDRSPVDLSDAAFPPTIQAVIAARLDTLSAEHKAVLQDASVIGKVFWPGALAAVGGRDIAEVRQALEELAEKELIEQAAVSSVRNQPEYSFSHILVRDVGYSQIPRATRAERHQRTARWIEEMASGRVADHAEILAHHAVRALELWHASGVTQGLDDLQDDARRYLMAAAKRAMAIDVTRAEGHLHAALLLSPPGAAHRPDVLAALGRAAFESGRMEEAERYYEAAVEDLSAAGRELDAAEATVGLFTVLLYRGETVRARELLSNALHVLQTGPNGPGLVRAVTETAGTLMTAGRHAEAVDAAGRAIELARGAGELEQEVRARGFRGYSRLSLGDADGIEEERLALADALRLGLGRTAAVIYNNLGLHLRMVEGPQQALECYREGIAFAEERGLQEMASWMGITSLLAVADLGDWDEVLRAGNLVASAAEARGAGYDQTFVQSVRALVLAYRGALGTDDLESLLERARAIGDPQVLVGALTAGAVAKQGIGEADEARVLTREAFEATEGAGSDMLAWYLPDLARVSCAGGDILAVERLAGEVPQSIPRNCLAVETARAAAAEARADLADALRLFSQSIDGWTAFGHAPERGQALFGASRCLFAMGRAEDGAARLAQAREVFTALGAAPLLDASGRWLRAATPAVG